jgi:hypothetical protein
MMLHRRNVSQTAKPNAPKVNTEKMTIPGAMKR